MNARRFAAPSGLLLAALVLALPGPGFSQKPPPPVKPNPAAPVLNFTGVLGGKRGAPVEIQLAGTNLADATTLLLGSQRFPVENKDNTKLKAQITLPADTPLGIHGLRVATSKGMS